MVLSKLTLATYDRIKLGIIDEYDLHQFLFKLFPDIRSPKFLYYCSPETVSQFSVLIQSEDIPVSLEIGKIETKQIPDDFYRKGKYLFKLRISPVRRNKHHVNAVLSDAGDILEWMNFKKEYTGITVESEGFEIISSGTIRMKQKRNSNRIVINYADVIGILTVNDLDKFKSTIRNGFGRCKGFGFGLFQLKYIGGQN